MANVKINIDSSQKILLKRKLNADGPAQCFFTSEVRRMADPYVPFLNGGLKDKQVQEYSDKIHYKAPYAKRMYNENKGYGIQGINNGGMRGKQWIPRMWSSKGKSIVSAVAKYVGGKAK